MHSDPSQTSKIKSFAKTVNDFDYCLKNLLLKPQYLRKKLNLRCLTECPLNKYYFTFTILNNTLSFLAYISIIIQRVQYYTSRARQNIH